MSYVSRQVEELRRTGIYGAERVDSDTISKILNMAEWEYYDIELVTLESYLGLLAQQIYFLQQEGNMAVAREIELGNDFKKTALPEVVGAKIRSVEERWLFAASLTPELDSKFNAWQNAIIDATLRKDLADPVIEKLQVLKKLYDERRLEGRNRTVHKYDVRQGG